MRHLLVLGSLLAAFACSDSKSSSPDAKVYMDGPGSGSGNVCTGAIYDPCNPANAHCGTGLTCKTFTGAGYSVCTQTCGTCPTGGTCNNMGICKPNAPNSCTPP